MLLRKARLAGAGWTDQDHERKFRNSDFHFLPPLTNRIASASSAGSLPRPLARISHRMGNQAGATLVFADEMTASTASFLKLSAMPASIRSTANSRARG